MKKSKILVVALIGLLLAGGLVLAGCDDNGTGIGSGSASCPNGECKFTRGDGNTFRERNICSKEECYVYKQANDKDSWVISTKNCDC